MKGTSRNHVLSQVKTIVLQQLRQKGARAYLFGSWARAEERRSSDIDIAVEFMTDDAANNRVLHALREALEESTLPYRVDVIHLNQADEYMIAAVRREGELWDERSSG